MRDDSIKQEEHLAKPGEKVFLTAEQVLRVVDMSPEGTIHTFLQNHHILVGADWSREALVREMGDAESMELAGAAARSMRHGVALNRRPPNPSPVFLATNEDRIRALEVEIG